MAVYKKTSPYYETSQNRLYLNLLTIRPVPAETDDFYYTIENQYEHRPDLLAFDLYGKPALWWVFAQRNMDVIRDQIFDFRSGVTISVPKKTGLFRLLGL